MSEEIAGWAVVCKSVLVGSLSETEGAVVGGTDTVRVWVIYRRWWLLLNSHRAMIQEGRSRARYKVGTPVGTRDL
jgi:hypothetical protein